VLIGELAEAVQLPAQTIRFYERKGLLPAPPRAANRYRTYDDTTIRRVRFIRTAQAAGLTLVEIGSITALRDDGHIPCGHVAALLNRKLDTVRARRRELADVETELEQLLSRSTRLDPADCGEAAICHILSPPTKTNLRRMTARPSAGCPQAWATFTESCPEA